MHVAEIHSKHHILTLLPTSRGLAYALFDGSLSIVDWGHHIIKGSLSNLKSTEMAESLIRRYVPDELVIKDTRSSGRTESPRIHLLNQSFIALARMHGVDVIRIDTEEVRKRFKVIGARTKQERAQHIAVMLPSLSHKLPSPRKPWMSEDARMAIFDAAALGLAYYGGEQVEE